MVTLKADHLICLAEIRPEFLQYIKSESEIFDCLSSSNRRKQGMCVTLVPFFFSFNESLLIRCFSKQVCIEVHICLYISGCIFWGLFHLIENVQMILFFRYRVQTQNLCMWMYCVCVNESRCLHDFQEICQRTSLELGLHLGQNFIIKYWVIGVFCLYLKQHCVEPAAPPPPDFEWFK